MGAKVQVVPAQMCCDPRQRKEPAHPAAPDSGGRAPDDDLLMTRPLPGSDLEAADSTEKTGCDFVLVDQRRFELLTSPVREENRPDALPAQLRVLPGQAADSTGTHDHRMALISTSDDDPVMTKTERQDFKRRPIPAARNPASPRRAGVVTVETVEREGSDNVSASLGCDPG